MGIVGEKSDAVTVYLFCPVRYILFPGTGIVQRAVQMHIAGPLHYCHAQRKDHIIGNFFSDRSGGISLVTVVFYEQTGFFFFGPFRCFVHEIELHRRITFSGLVRILRHAARTMTECIRIVAQTISE